MAAREIVMAVTESAYGVAKATPVKGTDSFYMRLDQAGAFKYTDTPVQASIPYGGGYNVEADTVSDLTEVKGTFNFPLYPGVMSSIMLNWAMTTINVARTAPWVTTDAAVVMPAGDLASLSFYHAVLKEDGATYDRKRIAGMKCTEWTLAADETQRIWRLSGSFTAQKVNGNPWDLSVDPVALEFPLPADTDYPLGPYTFGHLASGTGTVLLGSAGGTNRNIQCAGVSLKATNKMDAKYYTSRFIQTCHFLGRQSTAEVNMRMRFTPDDRASYRGMAVQTMKVILDNGVKSVTIDYAGNNLLRPWAQDLPLDKEYMQKLTFANRYSAATSADIVVTAAP